MEITKKVQYLNKQANDKFFMYDFLDLESNLPFTIYSGKKLEQYEKLENHKTYELKYNLILALGDKKVVWKIKGV